MEMDDCSDHIGVKTDLKGLDFDFDGVSSSNFMTICMALFFMSLTYVRKKLTAVNPWSGRN